MQNSIRHKLLGYYSLFIGVCVFGMWLMILSKGIVPEGKTEISFHLVSEFLMALLCMISGVMLLYEKKHARIISMAGLSMMVYSVLNAAGYYGQRNDMRMMILFIILLITTMAALYLAFTAGDGG